MEVLGSSNPKVALTSGGEKRKLEHSVAPFLSLCFHRTCFAFVFIQSCLAFHDGFRQFGRYSLVCIDDSIGGLWLNRCFVLLPRIEKYRPKHLDELVSHKDIIQTSMLILFANVC